MKCRVVGLLCLCPKQTQPEASAFIPTAISFLLNSKWTNTHIFDTLTILESCLVSIQTLQFGLVVFPSVPELRLLMATSLTNIHAAWYAARLKWEIPLRWVNRQKNYRSISHSFVHFVTSHKKDEHIYTAAEACTFQYPKHIICFDFFISPSSGTTIKIITEVNCLYTETLIIKNTNLLILFSCKTSLTWVGLEIHV
jgi:hypothetical protein